MEGKVEGIDRWTGQHRPFDRKWVDSLELGGRMGLTQSKLSSSPNGLSLPPSNWLYFLLRWPARWSADGGNLSVKRDSGKFTIFHPTANKQTSEGKGWCVEKGGEGEGGPRRIVAVFFPLSRVSRPSGTVRRPLRLIAIGHIRKAFGRYGTGRDGGSAATIGHWVDAPEWVWGSGSCWRVRGRWSYSFRLNVAFACTAGQYER